MSKESTATARTRGGGGGGGGRGKGGGEGEGGRGGRGGEVDRICVDLLGSAANGVTPPEGYSALEFRSRAA